MSVQLQRLRDRMKESGSSAVLLTNVSNIAWLTGFSGSSAFVIVTPESGVFITDSRYAEQANEQVKVLPVEIFANPVTGPQKIAEEAMKLNVMELGFEADHVTYAARDNYAKYLNGIELKPVTDLASPLRMVKQASEIDKIRAACSLADACFSQVLRMLQPGVCELDIAMDIDFYFRRQGAKPAFDTIAVSGERSSRPHGVPSEKKLEHGDFLTLDFGACLDGYNSDITRTVVIRPASDRHKQVYAAVLESQLAALDAMKPGVECRRVDEISRESLAKHDLAKYFGHGLGHGLGRLVHDFGGLNPSSTHVLEPGQVWTVEPGVYIAGFGGVRIEDDVLITDSGIEILTNSPKDLMIL